MEAIYAASLGFTKTSILMFYRRMTSNAVTFWLRWMVVMSIASVLDTMMVFLVTLFLQCRPLTAFWLQFDPVWTSANKFRCLNEEAHLLPASILSVIQDFIACCLPLVLIWPLQIRTRQAIALRIIFFCGFL